MKKRPPRRLKSSVIPVDETQRIIDRITECNEVIHNLESTAVWKIVMKDCQEQKQVLDDHWQDITDEKQLREARVLKLAYNYLLNIKGTYEEEKKHKQEDLDKIQNISQEIIKDYDLETTLEG